MNYYLPISMAPATITPARLCPHPTSTPEPGPTTPIRSKPPTVPRLPRISSDWEAEQESTHDNEWDDPWRQMTATTTMPTHVEPWQLSYFCSCSSPVCQITVFVPVDPIMSDSYAFVVMDNLSGSIYDAYLIKADIAKNENDFCRYQVVYSTGAYPYTLYRRRGRVGLQGTCEIITASWDLDAVVAHFRNAFLDDTGISWDLRHAASTSWPIFTTRRGKGFIHVDLDYSRRITSETYTTRHHSDDATIQLPDYEATDANIDEHVKKLMENVLYGGPMKTFLGFCEIEFNEPGQCSSFSAPYEQLSLWTVVSASQILERIVYYLEPKPEKPGTIRWKTILAISSRYRSQIPFCAGSYNSDRPAVVSNYHIVFLELNFLYSLHPRPEIASLMVDVDRKRCLQTRVYGKALATQPLYQAYSSLRHGFQLLTDQDTDEFRSLKSYLEGSCQGDTHHMTFELQGIYRVSVKAKLPNPYRHWLESKKQNTADTPAGGQSHDPPCSRLLLWHGTPLDSLLGILEHGLQIRRGHDFRSARSKLPAKFKPPARRRANIRLPRVPRTRAANTTAVTQAATTTANTIPSTTTITPNPMTFMFPNATNTISKPSALLLPPQPPTTIPTVLLPRPIPPLPRTTTIQTLTPFPPVLFGPAPPPPPPPPFWLPPGPPPPRRRPPFNGSMFGSGIYLADASSKSAQYCAFRTSAGEAVLLLCEADVGAPSDRIRSWTSIPDGHEVVREALGGMRGDMTMAERPRCIEGVGRTGPGVGVEGFDSRIMRVRGRGWKRVGWRLDWDTSGDGVGDGNKGSGGDRNVWMPVTTSPYGIVDPQASLAFNEYVIFNPAHVQIRYIFRLKIKDQYSWMF